MYMNIMNIESEIDRDTDPDKDTDLYKDTDLDMDMDMNMDKDTEWTHRRGNAGCRSFRHSISPVTERKNKRYRNRSGPAIRRRSP
jgi:hypothetical protein